MRTHTHEYRSPGKQKLDAFGILLANIRLMNRISQETIRSLEFEQSVVAVAF